MKLAIAALLGLALLPATLAGSEAEPEVTDAEGDCALPYGASYLDVVAVWIESETETSFVVATKLAAFDERVAEGAGYTIQFEHQGMTFGVVALYRPMSGAGWEFYTGRVDAHEAESDTLTPRQGSFDAASATFAIPFPKPLFPHRDASDRELRAFHAVSADLRPAYPFLLATDRLVDGSSNDRWLVCDEATSDATYAFRTGAHSEEHDHGAGVAEPPAAPAAAEAPAEGASPGAPAEADAPGARAVPLPAWLALVALAFSRVARSRER